MVDYKKCLQKNISVIWPDAVWPIHDIVLKFALHRFSTIVVSLFDSGALLPIIETAPFYSRFCFNTILANNGHRFG